MIQPVAISNVGGTGPVAHRRLIMAIGLALLVLPSPFAVAQHAGTGNIPEQQIAALGQELAKLNGQGDSVVARRRALKNIVRKAETLLDAAPDAPNRFVVLGLVFEGQKRLLALDNTPRNREALFATSEKLVHAPDWCAESRLEADLMLAEKQLSEDNATLEERATALAVLIERYRGTSAEAKSLLMAAMIVRQLDAPQLEDQILNALDENFSDDPEIIAFRRKNLRISRLDVTFKGEFRRVDGTELRFPADTMGHLCLMVFWSKSKPGIDAYLENMKEALAGSATPVDVFSFNVDELPDGGQAILREQGLDWTVMQLPDGTKHPAYRTYANGDPVAVLVNEYGLSVIRPEIVHGRMVTLDESRISEDRYTTQLQSLFIGDFLVTEPPGTAQTRSDSLPAATLRAVQECFPPAPFRYRLSREQALTNYTTAEKLCRDAIEQHAASPDIWLLRNRRMIALLGIWNLTCEPASLDKAVAEAKVALASSLPTGADVVPRFCLAKAALRRGDVDPKVVLARFMEATGGDNAPAPALAAAAMLALDAHSRELHELYREQLLAAHAGDPDLYAFTAFLNNRYHRFRLLKANHSHRERSTRGYIVNHGGEPMREPFPDIAMKHLDGSAFHLPRAGNGKMALLLFVEPPPPPEEDFPVVLDRRGNPTNSDSIRTVVSYAQDLAAQHVNHGVEVVVAFLCDDAQRVAELVKKNEWTGQPAIVPGGLNNPMVRQLGILSADRLPNVYLLRRDGTVAWRDSGLAYKGEFGFPFAYLLAMKVHIEACEVELGYRTLEKGDYAAAARIFAGPFLPANPDRYGWRSARYHGQARAQMGLHDYAAALEAIEVAIDAHKLRHYRGRGPKNPAEWRVLVADFTVKEPCDILALLWATKADILEKLGRKQEAAEVRQLADQPVKADYPSVYGTFHERLKKLTHSE